MERGTGLILDGCHGAGGWAEALRALGRHGLGVEYDPDMVATARAAGHACELGDVAAVDPRELLGGERCEGLIFSPPCPSFSAAGKQLGRRDLPAIHRLIDDLAAGVDSRADAHMHDPRSILSVEPMRWATLLLPEWIALEQVPAVLPLWEHMAEHLRSHHGYSVWTGVVYAERYGVPQTRQRAVLLASRAREVSEPVATHQRYYPPKHRYAVSGNGDGHLPRWISMAEALGWIEETVVNTRADRKTPGGNEFPASRPSWGLTEKTRSWHRWRLRSGQSVAGVGRAERDADDPSVTVTGRFDLCRWTQERSATTLSGDPRVSGPGHKDGRPGSGYPRQQDNAIRVSIQEAAVLQTFRPDYPFQGTRTKQFMQVGNAVPPRLAEALLRVVLGMGPRRLEDREPVDLEGDRCVATEQHLGQRLS
jgi:DNA (cytosine-5)-methyltransferase 1